MIKLKCRCGKEKDEGRSYCPDCLQKHREYQRKYKSKKRELKQPRNCPDCGVELTQPPSGGRPRHRCLKCAAALKDSLRDEEPRNCSDCGTEIPQPPRTKRGRPRKRCLKCAKEAIIRTSTVYRKRNISLGRCPCGKDRSVDGTYHCPNCLLLYRKYQREYRNRKAAQNNNQ